MAGRKTTPTTKIASLRLAAGLTQVAAAEAIGISKGHLAGMEKGDKDLGKLAFSTILNMAAVYHCAVEDLIG